MLHAADWVSTGNPQIFVRVRVRIPPSHDACKHDQVLQGRGQTHIENAECGLSKIRMGLSISVTAIRRYSKHWVTIKFPGCVETFLLAELSPLPRLVLL